MGKNSKKARKNSNNPSKKQHNHDNDDHAYVSAYADEDLDSNGFVKKGYTINFDDFAGGDDDDDEDGDEDGYSDGAGRDQAPRGGYGSQVLPVAVDLPEDFDGEPGDGDEYLFLVRREAAAHPGVIFSQEYVAATAKAAVQVTTTVSVEPVAGPSHRPSIEWRTSFLSRFTNMRTILKTAEDPDKKTFPIPPEYLPIPSAADESSWKSYIYGRRKKAETTETATSTSTSETSAAASSKGKERAVESNHAVEAVEIDGASVEAATEAEKTQAEDMDMSPEPATEGVDGSKEPSTSSAVSKAKMSEPKAPHPIILRSLDNYTAISLLEHMNGWLQERLDIQEQKSTPSTIFIPPSMRKRPAKPSAASSSSLRTPPPAPKPTPPAAAVKPLPESILSPLDSQWLFSLLTILDALLSSSEIGTLRTLVRTCQEIADMTQEMLDKHAESTDEEGKKQWRDAIASCWMVTAAVWEIWGQRDLWV